MTEAGRHTRAVLSRYREQMGRCKRQKEKVAQLSRGVSAGQGAGIRAGIRGGGAGNPVEQTVLHLEQERGRLRAMCVELSWYRSIVRLYVGQTADPVTRYILSLRYLGGLSWKQIAVRHGAGATEDAMRKTAARYMDAHPLKGFR